MKTLSTCLCLIVCVLSYAQTSKRQPNYDSLRIVLEKMGHRDQEIRRILIDSIGLQSPDAGIYVKQMMDIDADNQHKLVVILDKYGWIPQSKIGKKAAEALFYIVQHADSGLMAKWFPEFKRLANMGEADAAACAMMEDRLLMWSGKKQIYGTQAATFRADGKLAIWPIENPKTVNERRKKLGFPLTVEENAVRLEAIYNEDEQLPDEPKKN
jgi:hypothetical protein